MTFEQKKELLMNPRDLQKGAIATFAMTVALMNEVIALKADKGMSREAAMKDLINKSWDNLTDQEKALLGG